MMVCRVGRSSRVRFYRGEEVNIPTLSHTTRQGWGTLLNYSEAR